MSRPAAARACALAHAAGGELNRQVCKIRTSFAAMTTAWRYSMTGPPDGKQALWAVHLTKPYNSTTGPGLLQLFTFLHKSAMIDLLLLTR